MNLGYARVSKDDQTTAPQLRALKEAGCDAIYQEKVSSRTQRPELETALASLQEGDTLTVWKFDRLGRSLPDLLQIVEQIETKGAHLSSLTEKIDTGTSAGRVVFHVMAALGQFERDLIRERTLAGLAAARAEGRIGGRPRALTDAQVTHAMRLIDGDTSPSAVARSFGVAASTLRAHIAKRRAALTHQ